MAMKKKIEVEYQRINKLLEEAGVATEKIQLLEPIIENAAWMKDKLDESRRKIKNSEITIEYNNGGGQQGIRENPIYKAYEALWKSYMQAMSRIIDCIPDEKKETKKEEIEKPRSMLEIVRSKKEA